MANSKYQIIGLGSMTGEKIKAIKNFREILGGGLLEAKLAIESIIDETSTIKLPSKKVAENCQKVGFIVSGLPRLDFSPELFEAKKQLEMAKEEFSSLLTQLGVVQNRLRLSLQAVLENTLKVERLSRNG